MGAFVDRTGHRYGRLLVISRDMTKPPASKGRRVYWRCECDCGTPIVVSGHELHAGTQSCGCLQREAAGNSSRRHGYTRTKTYRSWQAIRRRCHVPTDHAYFRYGARGIKVCRRWRESFEAFLADMGEAPAGRSLDRIDGTKGYEPGNCRWATSLEQGRNKLANVEWRGQRITRGEIADEHGIPHTSFNKALRRLGDIDAALAYVKSHRRNFRTSA